MPRPPKFPENIVKVVAPDGNRPRLHDPGKKEYPDLRDAYYRVLETAFPQIDRKEFSYRKEGNTCPLIPDLQGQFWPTGSYPLLLQMTPKQRKAVNELFLQIRIAIATAYQHGLVDGRDLLTQLAKGDFTLKDFDAAENAGKRSDDEES
jgi:hypothetical protein